MGQQKSRSVIIILCAILSFAATVGGIRTILVNAGIETGATGIGVGMTLELHTKNVEASQQFVGERIVFLGDSTVVDYPYLRTVPDNLRRLIGRFRGHTSLKTLVIPIAAPGMSAPEYYAFADRIAAFGPDQVVFPINLASFSDIWKNGFDRRESIGWIPPGRLPDLLTRPFHELNLTLDRILLYMGIVGFGLQESWKHYSEEKIRAVHGIGFVRRALQPFNPRRGPDGLPYSRLPFQAGNPKRSNQRHVESLYGRAMSGIEERHPVVRMLAGALEIYQSAGVRVLAYTVPMNYEHFEGFGFDTRTGTKVTIEMLREMVASRGGIFLDLHRLFRDEDFRDIGGHFLQKEGFDGSMIVAGKLFPELMRNKHRRAPDPTRETN